MSAIEFTGVPSFRTSINFVGMYSDGVPMVKTDQFKEIVEKADTLVLRAESLSQFVVAMFLVDSIHVMGGRIEKLILPYLPGARQDRVNVEGDVLFTSYSVAEMINSRGFSRVLVLDPHSPMMPSLIRNVEEYPLERVASCYNPKNWDAIIAPDKGAKDRAEQFAKALGLPVVYASKVRDVSTGRLSGFSVEVESGKKYLVVDDICDGGGTFVGLGEKIVEQGASADLYVTHGIFSKGTKELNKLYGIIYTTNSRDIHGNADKICGINIVRDMENYND